MESAFQVVGAVFGLGLLALLAWAFTNYAEEKGYPLIPVFLLVLLTGPVGVVIVWLLPERIGSPAYARRAAAMRNAVPRSRKYASTRP